MMKGLNLLEPYLPPGATELAANWFDVPGLSVKLVNRGHNRMGSFLCKSNGLKVITLNIKQDIYNFLLTLAHEVAHLQVYQRYGRHPAPHGAEWKNTFRKLLVEAAQLPSLPPDIKYAMLTIADNPKSTHFAHQQAGRILLKYSNVKQGTTLLDDLPEGSRFLMPDGKVFVKGEKRRTRYKCNLNGTSRIFLIGGSVPVFRVA